MSVFNPSEFPDLTTINYNSSGLLQVTGTSTTAINFNGTQTVPATIVNHGYALWNSVDGNLQIRPHDNPAGFVMQDSAANASAKFTFPGGLQMFAAAGAAPTGGDKGTGTINVATNIFLNGTAYTNPDYVLEHYYTGKIEKFKDNLGATDYKGLPTLQEVESFMKENLHLPVIRHDNIEEGHGLVERFEWLLINAEQDKLHILELDKRIKLLEDKLVQVP